MQVSQPQSISITLVGFMVLIMMMPFFLSACQPREQVDEHQLLEEARNNLEAGNFQKALAQLSKALSKDPNNIEVHENLAWVYLYTDEFEKASREIQYIASHKPKNPKLHYLRGYLFAQLEQWVDALESYDLALQTKDANNPSLHFDIASAFLAVNEPEAALREFDMALRLDPGNSSYEFGKCMTYRQLKRYDKALMFCKLAMDHTNSQEEQDRIQEVIHAISLLQIIDINGNGEDEAEPEYVETEALDPATLPPPTEDDPSP